MDTPNNGSSSSEDRRKRSKREWRKTTSRSSPSAAGSKDAENMPSHPIPSTSKSTTKEEKKMAANGGFDGGTDFIPFSFSDSESMGDLHNGGTSKAGRVHGKGKEKAREDHKQSSIIHDGRKKANGQVREWDMGKPRQRSRERHRDRRDRDRDRDRRKRRRDDIDDGGTTRRRWEIVSSKKAPWVASVDWENCNNVAELLHNEVEAFVRWVSPTPIEDEIRGLVVDHIARAVTAAYPDAQLLPFGSYATKLYLPLGDIDLVILSESMAYSNKVNVLHSLASVLKRAGITSRVSIVAKAKVPIVKFVTTHGRFNVDISINQSNGIVAGRIINGFLRDMHSKKGGIAMRALVLITKAFLGQRSLNEVYTGGLGSYSVVCLAVSFLQMHPKIRRGEIDAEDNLGVLVMEFFELYGHYFNYEEVGISVRDGGTYYNKRERGWYDYYKGGLLSIEDPTDPSNDISRGSFAFANVRTSFAGAYVILTSAAYQRATILKARRDSRSHRLRDRYEPEDMSILSSVIGITQETLNHRTLIKELYESRTLHDLLGVKPIQVVNDIVVMDPSGSSKTNSEAARLVRSTWEGSNESDMEGDAGGETRLQRDQDEGGRYDIGRKRPRRRRKLGRDEDLHTYFVTDDEGEDSRIWNSRDESLANSLSRDSLHGEGAVYASQDSSVEARRAKKRAYWLSKGSFDVDSG